LRDFLARRKGGKISVALRFTNAKGQRRRIIFNMEIVGTNHHVEWVPSREERASPDW
jgi:hypothetical protein